MSFKQYEVTVTAKFPAAGERPGTFEVHARDAKHAVSIARDEMWKRGHTKQDGPLKYKARLVATF